MSTFLLVDESRLMRNILRDIITLDGHTIIGEASDGQQAFEEYKSLSPEVVIMDISAEDGDGIQGLGLIKEFDPDATVIISSSLEQQWLVVEAVKLGATEFIIKPFTQDAVLDVIAKILER